MLNVDIKSYLSKHDLVFLSPPREGWEGLPLGNGSFGGPLWAAEDGLIFQANHTDTFELPDPQGGEQKAGWTVLRSCGRLRIQHSVPMHNWLYLDDFEARLSLSDAEACFAARTAFGRFETTAYIHAGAPVAVFRHHAAYAGDLAGTGAPIRILLERWGSRVFGWWYNHIQGGASFSLGNTEARADGDDACLETTFRGVRVALRCRVIGKEVTAHVNHSHQAEITVRAAPQQDFAILLACVTSHESTDPAASAKAAIEAAAAKSDLAVEHRQWWAQFWSRSFVHISQDYFENLYYLHHYLMGSSCRGKHPPLFNGGLWTWNHDVRNWVNPHHWNEQQSFWCLPAANRADLLRPYLDTYHRLMPQAIAATKRRGFEGMLWIDQHDFGGRQVGEEAPSFRDNYTPASQIALFFWWHYRYTGDLAYLREKGYPFMAAAGDFYLGLVRWIEEDNRYEIPLASTYEDERPLRFTDTITNLAMIRALFPALIEAGGLLTVDADKRTRWQHVLDHLPPYRLNERDKARGVTLTSGLVDGKELPEKEDHNHGPLFCPVFPAGDLGLKDAGTPLFEAARHTLATYPPVVVAITPTVCIAARLGMADVAAQRLETMVRMLQHFPNGMFFNIDHWDTLSRRCAAATVIDPNNVDYGSRRNRDIAVCAAFQRDYLDDRGCRFSNVRVLGSAADGIEEHRADMPCDPFSQMGMESLGNFTAGLQEMLLQSHERAIRVFPATPDEWECAFTLLAQGGFLVTSRREAGQPVRFIEILSKRGGRCAVIAPWPGQTDVLCDGRPVQDKSGIERVEFDTAAGQRYLLVPHGASAPNPVNYSGQTNSAPKRFHEAMIGSTRDF